MAQETRSRSWPSVNTILVQKPRSASGTESDVIVVIGGAPVRAPESLEWDEPEPAGDSRNRGMEYSGINSVHTQVSAGRPERDEKP